MTHIRVDRRLQPGPRRGTEHRDTSGSGPRALPTRARRADPRGGSERDRGRFDHDSHAARNRAHAARWYFLPDSVRADVLEPSDTTSHCPFKRHARYWNLWVGDRVIQDGFWEYPRTLEGALAMSGLLALTTRSSIPGASRTKSSAGTLATRSTALTRATPARTSRYAPATI